MTRRKPDPNDEALLNGPQGPKEVIALLVFGLIGLAGLVGTMILGAQG